MPADKNALMQRAGELALRKMREGGGGPFGAVIVRDGAVIAEGWNTVTTENDPTAHAEIVAIRNACASLKSFSLEGCEIYTSCEPLLTFAHEQEMHAKFSSSINAGNFCS